MYLLHILPIYLLYIFVAISIPIRHAYIVICDVISILPSIKRGYYPLLTLLRGGVNFARIQP